MTDGIIKPKDASHILDNEPKPARVREPMHIPLTSQEGAGAPEKPLRRPDGRRAGIRGEVVDTLTSEDQQRMAVAAVENCGNCHYSRGIDLASERGRAEFKAIQDWIESQTGQLPDHVQSVKPLGSAAERIICDHPSGAKGLTFPETPACQDWKKRRHAFTSYATAKPPGAVKRFVRKINHQLRKGKG
jgi:hypothetical protein